MPGDQAVDRRRRILDVATRHFARTHYDKVSTVSIAAEADVNRGWIYHEFGSKRDLYLAVLRSTVRTPSLPPLAALRGRGDVEQALSAVLDEWLDEVWANRESYLAVQRVHAGFASDPEIQAMLHTLHSETINRVLATMVSDSVEVSEASRALVACYGELTWQALREWLDTGRLDRAQLHLMLVKSFMMLFELGLELARAGRAGKAR